MADGRPAVVFDLDGTLVDTLCDILAAMNRVLAEEGLRTIDYAEGRPLVGHGARRFVRGALEAAGMPDFESRFEPCYRRFFDYYAADPASRSAPYPHAREAAEALHAAGYGLGLCTNKPHAISVRILELLKLDALFGDAVFGGDALPVRKPDPGHLLAVLERLGAAPARAVMIGDSANDVAAARGAGVPVIVVSFGYTDTPAAELGADAVIDSFAELERAVAAVTARRQSA